MRLRFLVRVGCYLRYVIGRVWILGRQFERARFQLQVVSSRCPELFRPRAYLAWMHAELGSFDQAVAEYRELIAVAPGYLDGYVGLASALQRLDNHDEAIQILRLASEKDPYNHQIYYFLGASYLARGELQNALVEFRRAARLEPNDAETLGNLGVTLGRLGHWEDAVELNRRALKLKPAFEHAYNLGVDLMELGRFAEAEAAFRTALRLEKGPSDTTVRLALALRDQGKLAEAAAILNQLTSAGKEDASALAALSDVLLLLNRTGEALSTARLAVKQSPHLPAAHGALGWALIQSASRFEALNAFDRALALSPGELDYMAGRGTSLSLLDRHAMAVEMFDHILAADPEYFMRYSSLSVHLQRSRAALAE